MPPRGHGHESPTVGRSAVGIPGSHLPEPGHRFQRHSPTSPLSTTNPVSPSQRQDHWAPRVDSRQSETQRAFPGQTATFFDDSSNPPSPESTSSRFASPTIPNENRSVSQPYSTIPPQGIARGSKSAMAGPVAAVQGEASGLPRNSSIDSAISAVSSKSGAPNEIAPDSNDIANLIKKAGSPEAVIQHLLREKHSQSQQNNQLWRLVDKQRAMILGLNKDLERALKDKEKYKTKLKEVMSNQVIRTTGLQSSGRDSQPMSRPIPPRVDSFQSREHTETALDSPTLDSDSQKHSPIDVALAPYPITPPTDQFTGQAAALRESPSAMPKSQEHAVDKYDHEADERAADKARKLKGEDQLKDIPFNAALPPSRSLPSIPPSGPPPKLPANRPAVSQIKRKEEGLSNFPTPPRKAPPAPLQLRPKLEPPPPALEDDESDSDIEGLLHVEAAPQKRGRRRTRAEDDRIREVLAQEAEARSASKKSNQSSKPTSPTEEVPPSSNNIPVIVQPVVGTASLNAVLQGDDIRSHDLTVPLRSPGLPISPRPNMASLNSPPLSPRTAATFTGGPLSPRPPRQPIPLPPNTPLATPAVSGSKSSSKKPPQPTRTAPEPAQPSSPSEPRSSPVERPERIKVYKGLVTDEYPDLLLPPNALPSIAVHVASSRMKPSRASLISLTQLEEDPVFTLAITSRADRGELWRVEKDSASLSKLDQRLKQCSSFTAKTPDRALFSGHAPAKLDARRIALEHYMEELLNTPLDIPTALELCRYISTNTLPPNADETGATTTAAVEGSAHMIGPDGRPVRSGYLTKRGKNFGGWKSRFFLLDGPALRYYETPGGAHLGTIKLQNAQIGKQSQPNDRESPTDATPGEDTEQQYRHAFLILEPKKKDSSSHVKHVLCAESDRERDLWVDALLQWIDYRDPDEEPPASAKSHGKLEKQGGKSRKGNQSHKSHHAPTDSDTLVGVRYDSTNAGEAPSSGPERKASGGGDLNGEGWVPQAQPKVISGPKDPQPISDTAAWGNKLTLAPPSHEEKKARKRSFFGFGPKTRSSSEGQETLQGSLDAASLPHNHYQGIVRHVFGSPLAEAARYNPPIDVHVPLPSVVYRCIQYLDFKDAVLEEGIFRLSGSNVVIKQIRERFNNESDVNLIGDENFYDIHAVASLLKLYLRELPITILTRDLHMDFLATIEMQDKTEKLATLAELSQRLPLPNATLLKYLIAFLIKIIDNADMNKMTVRNVGIVFSPTLNIPAPVFAMFLQNYEAIFGLDPYDYELPILAPEAEHQETPRFEPPARPSTSSGNASPHRQQVRLESMRDYQRSSPTPPLLMNLNAARGSPTPTSTRPGGYEPSYQTRDYMPPHSARQAPYEMGYGQHNAHEPQHHYAQARATPGYDRSYPSYSPSHGDHSSNLAVQDPPHSSGRRNRESAMFMGNMVGLHHQSSNSRLREENRH